MQRLQSRLQRGRIDDRFSQRQGQKESAWAALTPGVYLNAIFRQSSWLNVNIHWVESCQSGKKELQNGDVAQKEMSPETVSTRAAADKRLQLPFLGRTGPQKHQVRPHSLNACVIVDILVVKQTPGSICEARYMSV